MFLNFLIHFFNFFLNVLISQFCSPNFFIQIFFSNLFDFFIRLFIQIFPLIIQFNKIGKKYKKQKKIFFN